MEYIITHTRLISGNLYRNDILVERVSCTNIRYNYPIYTHSSNPNPKHFLNINKVSGVIYLKKFADLTSVNRMEVKIADLLGNAEFSAEITKIRFSNGLFPANVIPYIGEIKFKPAKATQRLIEDHWQMIKIQCECGAEKCNLPTHSSWCPKYIKY